MNEQWNERNIRLAGQWARAMLQGQGQFKPGEGDRPPAEASAIEIPGLGVVEVPVMSEAEYQASVEAEFAAFGLREAVDDDSNAAE